MKKRIKNYIAIFQEEKEGGYSVWVPALPGCASQGDTLEDAIVHIREAITLYLEDNDSYTDSDAEVHQFVIPIQANA